MQKPVAIVGVVLVAAVVAFFVLRPKAEPPPPPPPPPPAQAQQAPPDVQLPPIETSDAQVRRLLAGLPQAWLAQDDLLTRWVTIADNLAEDVSPRKQLAAVAPAKPFSAPGDKLDEHSYRRYDAFADAIAAVDAKQVAAAVKELHPLLDAAYHKLGYPDRRYDDVARKALKRLVDAPVVEGPIPLVQKGAVYKFAADELEALGPVEKHLLRMGPRNTKLIQAKARELLAAL
jgi:hypothetical protein